MSVFFLGRRLSGRFVTPSGILTTRTGIIDRVVRTIPEIGVITTKSVGVEPEPGYREPILAEDSPLNFVNAVGLRSPGMVTMREELAELREGLIENSCDGQRNLMTDRFLLVSVFGKTEEEFATLVRDLAPVADGIELNLSCPHSKPGYGASIGSHPDTTSSFTRAAVEASREEGIERPDTNWTNRLGHIPIFVKLTPNVEDIGVIAEAALKAGATGITAINTVGPIEHRDPGSGEPVLTHVTGGKSGRWVLNKGAACVNRIREVVGPGVPIIGMGGIATAENARLYSGADLLGVGSTLAGLDIEGIAGYFQALENDLKNDTAAAGDLLSTDRLMEYKPFRISEVIEKDDDLRVFVLDGGLDFDPAQFVFLWLPGIGEKPFSPAKQEPLTLAIRKRGIFTERLFELGPGDTIHVRGPYGRGFQPGSAEKIVILSGGTGSGVALRLAEEAACMGKNVQVFQGSVNERQVLFEHDFRKHGRFIAGIDHDGPGEVLKVLENHLRLSPITDGECTCFTIGPEILMREGMRLFSRYTSDQHIYASVERETLCGVGLCGACELNGYRTCIRETVMSLGGLRGTKLVEGLP